MWKVILYSENVATKGKERGRECHWGYKALFGGRECQKKQKLDSCSVGLSFYESG